METSAGGVVLARRGGQTCVALVEKHNGNWVLPKGHVEAGESHEEAALREIGQETGLWTGLELLERLGGWLYNEHDPTRHSDKLNHFFLVIYAADEQPALTTDESHKSARWHSASLDGIRLEYAYQREVISAALEHFQAARPRPDSPP